MNIDDIRNVYFLGAGGIGMSALERYFLACGKAVAGYDRTPTELTRTLESEGALIHYEDDPALIPDAFRDKAATLVVLTPAIPAEHREWAWLREQGFTIRKRAEVLGLLTHSMRGLCVAGTHGKTTTTAMAAHLLHQSHVGCNAFLGGITKNYGTNYLFSEKSPYVVIEADEYDRSFHHLRPFASVITSTDPDHLDIYGTPEAYVDAFRHYTTLVQPGGALVVHTGLKLKPEPGKDVRLFSYGREAGDFHAERLRIGGGRIVFDLASPLGNIADVELGVPVSVNIENGIAAMALAQIAGAGADEIRAAMASFGGVDRRFDFKIKRDDLVFLSDYAHHPEEIRQSILSVREVFAGRRLTAIFQPHLYSRTKDFYREFAESLSLLDEVILVDIYPAREKPLPGVTSQLIYDNLRPGIARRLVHKEELPAIVRAENFDVLFVLGAGDVDDYVPELTAILLSK
ncbi:MAG: UDP-N-acetylmuramate--L-alanine ligase [Alloprevotella sp.]|nr:UDP-N-acetylmuramate--L-alanine ligase [Alloprevotella sp.]MBR1653030.1 UDP-N-acetylmuramate--L-alanine ligase [Alloprevotella sp.]MBR1653219.1 UDP-N-acetylmuramate--L-alanine ligase [Alloprevotella sp.]